MKDLFLSYLLCAAGLFTPLAGLHRFYMGDAVLGCVYLLTWGFMGIGTIVDLIRMTTIVDNHNLRVAFSPYAQNYRLQMSSPERSILKCAYDNNGLVTLQMVALATGLNLKTSKSELDRLFKQGFCTKDVDEEGNEIYHFTGLRPKKV
jgi:hypothetical protein